eukprot:TRINITY_DN87677_c0_g1_i1.p1 TRINITY_DN87677_c0_g1~~TRINITY_DN87677_c0_g1_i1.p1  ORF type:complete len:844 (-),score=158.87 TRINITY_DN87677_c0_g1_i1:347-2878(-)
MGRGGFDDRDNKQVMGFLVPQHFVALQPGQSALVDTTYAGQLQCQYKPTRKNKNSEEVVGEAPEGKTIQYKCKHCSAQFSGPPRRVANHFLPKTLPSDFFPKGTSRGCEPCNAPLREVQQRLAELGCSEYGKLLAMEAGKEEEARAMCALGPRFQSKAAFAPEVNSKVAEQTKYRVDDEQRYRKPLLNGSDVARLLGVAFARKAIPLTVVEDEFFKRAFEVLGYSLPSRKVFENMRARESAAAQEVNQKWFRATGFGTVCADTRKMHEGKDKNHMLNFSFVSKAEERYVRSGDMSAFAKDCNNNLEFIRSAWTEDHSNRCGPHLAPTIPLSCVAGLCLDQPNTNVAVLRELQLVDPSVAPIACSFHGYDGILGKLFEKVPLLAQIWRMYHRLNRLSRNLSRVRSALTSKCQEHAKAVAAASGKKVKNRYFVKLRTSRNYPKYLVVKRAYQLMKPACQYYRSPAAIQDAGPEKAEALAKVKEDSVANSATFRTGAKVVSALLRPLMQKLRLADSTRQNMFSCLMLHHVDVRSRCMDVWVSEADQIKSLMTNPDLQHEEGKKQTQDIVTEGIKKLSNIWVRAAHLLDPYHIILYRKEKEEHGNDFRLQADYDPKKNMPGGLEDTKLHRTLVHFGMKAMDAVSLTIWPEAEDEATKAANRKQRQMLRTQLKQYVDQSTNFEESRVPNFWYDAEFDAMAKPYDVRPVPLWQLWEYSELTAPQLQHVMQRLAGLWPSQGSCERANGIFEYTTGAKRRNSLSMSSRIDIAFIADRHGRETRQKRHRANKVAVKSKHLASDSEESEGDDEPDVEGAPEVSLKAVAPGDAAVNSDDEWSSDSSSCSGSESD